MAGPRGDADPMRPNAAPPPCPRCELVKSQATKTVINYQKSHRRKVEALRAELKSSRQQVQRLQGQLRFYRFATKAIPAAALLGGAAWLLARVLRRRGAAGASAGGDSGGKAVAAAAAAEGEAAVEEEAPAQA
ncbi:hypothetical protein HYH03_012687 [Edaphochlamys debaryana]|uniref:Uncharacterized protein n=1 Tax=Edaphochlamys debaryana TaxID=47281 RepID=A0A835XRD4_9CHLO|nr:hypothetical protein HYH03_012687 [Edaphochlamys debaryana]|eukprot:KAG2488686.1 hypothetical protein HYH03_012687 [Edaphochlamys debaryana]